MSQPDVTTDSGDSSADGFALTRCNDDNLDVSGVPAVVTWFDHDSGRESRHHSTHAAQDLTLHMHCDTSSNTAFLQLRAHIALKARRDKTNLLISIPPERVRTATLCGDDGGKELATRKLSTSTHCVRFHLSKPPSLIVPKGDLTPKQKNSRIVLDSVHALAKQMSFSVHLPCSTTTKARLLSFCKSVMSSTVQSTPKFVDIASLYGGKGGRVIEHEPRLALTPGPTAAEHVAQSPPSYDELGLSSPPRPKASQSKTQPLPPPLQSTLAYQSTEPGGKRRRGSSSSDYITVTQPQDPVHNSIEKICMEMMERVESGFSEIGLRLDRMEKRLVDLEASVERRADELGISVERAQQRSSEQVEEVRDELDRGLHDVKQETEDVITLRVEDEMYVARGQLEDFVKDEMASTEERLEERLQDSITNASVSLDFSWNR